MPPDRSEFVKVHVTFANCHEEGGPPVSGEYIWAMRTPVHGHFELNNIPFFADFGLGDIVAAEPVVMVDGTEYDLEITTIVTPSGNLTTRLFFSTDLPAAQRQQVADVIKMREGCSVEWANSRLLAVSISPKHTVEAVVGEFVKSGAAICDLYDQEEVSDA
jgi:hypothetical protein